MSGGSFLCSTKWAKGGGFRFMVKDSKIRKLYLLSSLFLYYIKQIDFMLPCVCSVIDHRRRQNVVRTSVTHSVIALCATFLFLPHFDVICDLLLNRCMATWNLFANYATLLYTRLLYSMLRYSTCLYSMLC